MGLKFFLSLFLLFVLFFSCGKEKRKGIWDKHETTEQDIRSAGFSKMNEDELLAFLSSLKTNLPGMTARQFDDAIVLFKLRINELYEKKYTKEKLSEESYKDKFSEADILRRLDEVTEKYQSLRKIRIKNPDAIPYYKNLEAIVDSYRDFGDLYLAPKRKESGKLLKRKVLAKTIPWAGHWYPLRKKTLYKDKNSPLSKLDAIVRAKTKRPSFIRAEQERILGSVTVSPWEGYCDGWSIASTILGFEPNKPITLFGITLEPKDQKGLWTFYHLQYSYKKYGFSYKGNRETDGTFQDINPQAFHRVTTKVIGEQGRSTIIDSMSGHEAWNKPMFFFSWVVKEDPESENSFLVDATAKLVKQREIETNMTTNAKDFEHIRMTYRVYVDKNKVVNGEYLVLLGEWTERSFFNHPDNIKVPYLNKKSTTYNKEFNKHLDILELMRPKKTR